jgi:hypothetical protein
VPVTFKAVAGAQGDKHCLELGCGDHMWTAGYT